MTTWLLGLAAKATLLLLSLAVAGAAVRRSPAATRHFVWLSGLAALLFLPLLVAVTPGWSPGWAAELLPDYLLTDAPDAVAKAPPRESLAFVGSANLALMEPMAEVPAAITGGSQAAGVHEGSRLAKRSLAGALSSSTSFWLAFVWAGGALAMLCRLAVGFGRRAHLARRAAAVEAGAMVEAGEIAARTLSLRRRVRLLLGDTAVVPMTWGIARPVLFLPAAAKHWSARRLNTVLLHELAHIKRHDSLSRSLAQLACSVFWFHPLAWLSARRMLREQERACDDVVILAGADPHHYAETLVAIAREFRSPRPSVVGALAFARRSNLEHRVLSILDPLERRRKLSFSRKAMVLALFVGLALPLAALHPTASAQQPDARPQAEQKGKPRPDQKSDPQAEQKSKPLPKSVIIKRADGSAVQVGVAVPRADAPTPRVGVAVPRADAAPQVGVVVPRADAAPQVGVVVPRADAAPQVGVAVRRADASSPQVAVGVPRADAAAPQVGVAVRRADAAAPQVAVGVPRGSGSSVGIGVVAPRASGSATGVGGVAPRASVGAAGVGVGAPRSGVPAPQTGTVWTQRPSSRIQLEAEGAIRIGGSAAEVELGEGGFLTLTEGDRRLEIRPSGAGLEFEYTVDDAEVDFDADAREWADEILGHVAEMGTLRGNIFISTSRSEVSGELTSVVLEPLELSIAQLELVDEPLVVSVESLELAEESLQLALEKLEMTHEPLAVTLESLDEHLVLSVEALESIGEHLTVTLEPALAEQSLQLALERLELAQEPLSVTIESLESMPESLVLHVEPLELAAESLALSLEPLELALEMPLLEGMSPRRFDRVYTWSEDGSRFVAMWRGPVELGESIDAIDVGAGGDLVIDERAADGVHRRLHVSGDEGGGPTFEWFIDGETVTFDADGRAWLRPVLDWLNENAG